MAAGDHAEVISLTPDGIDPQTYELTDADLARLENVKFFFVNGLGLDTHLQQVIEQNRDERSFVIPFAPNVQSPTSSGLTADEAQDEAHLWLDPRLAVIYVAIVADEFVIYDEVNRGLYETNYRSARMFLTSLAETLAAEAGMIAEENRRLVVRSDSLTHFARALDLEIAVTADAIAGETSEDIADRLAGFVTDNDVPAVFGEYGHDNSVLRTVASMTGARLCTLYTDIVPLDLLRYEDLMRANVDEVVRCLAE